MNLLGLIESQMISNRLPLASAGDPPALPGRHQKFDSYGGGSTMTSNWFPLKQGN